MATTLTKLASNANTTSFSLLSTEDGDDQIIALNGKTKSALISSLGNITNDTFSVFLAFVPNPTGTPGAVGSDYREYKNDANNAPFDATNASERITTTGVYEIRIVRTNVGDGPVTFDIAVTKDS